MGEIKAFVPPFKRASRLRMCRCLCKFFISLRRKKKKFIFVAVSRAMMGMTEPFGDIDARPFWAPRFLKSGDFFALREKVDERAKERERERENVWERNIVHYDFKQYLRLPSKLRMTHPVFSVETSRKKRKKSTTMGRLGRKGTFFPLLVWHIFGS